MIQIDKGVPIPDAKNSSSSRPLNECEEVIRKLEVGESFSYNDGLMVKNAMSIASVKLRPKKFVSRKEGLDLRRVWRIR